MTKCEQTAVSRFFGPWMLFAIGWSMAIGSFSLYYVVLLARQQVVFCAKKRIKQPFSGFTDALGFAEAH